MKDKLSVFDRIMMHLELYDIPEDDVFYLQQLRISHDALLSAARRFNSMAEHIMLNRPVRDMGETMVEVLTAIANAENLT